MTPFYIKAPNAQVLIAAAPNWIKGIDDNGNVYVKPYSRRHAFNYGLYVMVSDAEYADDGSVITPAVWEDGYFANVRILDESLVDEFIAAVGEYIIPEPSKVQNAWAGD